MGINKPAAIIRVITAVSGVIILGLCAAGRPKEFLTETDLSGDSFQKWRLDFFLSIAVLSLIYSIGSLVFAFLSPKAASLRLVDVVVSVVFGILLIVAIGLKVAEYVHWFIEGVDSCLNYPFSYGGYEGSMEHIQEAYKECNSDGILNCYCMTNEIMKFDLNMAATGIATLNAILYFVGAGMSLRSK